MERKSTAKRLFIKRRLRLLVGAILSATLVTVVSGCSSSSASTGSASASTQSVTIGYADDTFVNGYDPAQATGGGIGGPTWWEALYDSLFASTSDGSVKPGLASSYSYNSTKTVLTLQLRTDVTFTDGSKLTASLVKQNLDRRSDPTLSAYSVFNAGGAAQIQSVAAPSTSTVVITFVKPSASAVSLLGDLAGRIVGESAIENPATLKTTPDGSGPYTLQASATIKGNTYTMVKKSNYWNSSIYPYKTIVFKVLPDAQSLANALASGQVQIAVKVDSTTLSVIKAHDTLVTYPGSTYGFVVFDKLGKLAKPFASVQVRQALSLAIDRSAVASVDTQATPSANLFPEGTPGYSASLNTTYAYNVTKAKQLLTQAGYPNGFSFTLYVAGTTYNNDLDVVKTQWAKVGVDMKVQQVANPVQAVTTSPLGYFNFAVGADPLDWVTTNLLSVGLNPQGVTSDAIEAAVSQAESGSGASDTSALTALNEAIVNDGWFIPVYTQPLWSGYDATKVAKPELASPTSGTLLSSIQPASK